MAVSRLGARTGGEVAELPLGGELLREVRRAQPGLRKPLRKERAILGLHARAQTYRAHSVLSPRKKRGRAKDERLDRATKRDEVWWE